VKKVGVLYHPKVKESENFARKLESYLKGKKLDCWLHSSWEEAEAARLMDGTDLVISVGGDGTILRVARIIFPRAIPIVGINFGKLGFMTELEADGANDKLDRILDGEGWIEQRTMLQAVLGSGRTYHALNDVVVGRGRNMRLVNIEVGLDGTPFTTYRADAVIVATSTGSTGYTLAANGPVLYPESRDIILKAVCPHLSLDKALVLSPETKVSLRVHTNHEAVVSMDGQVEEPLGNGDGVVVSLSPHVTRFTRLRPRSDFYSTLTTKLKGKSL